jgi:thiamine-monophosphate kinase
VSRETDFIAALREIASHPAARGLADDAALLEIGGSRLVLTHDMLVEGVHYLPGDAPEDVAWKLVAVNLSDLAAKGARPVGALLGYTLGEEAWDRRFADGLRTALEGFGMALLGGDTVTGAGRRTLGLTAIGQAFGPVPSRSGARPGDHLWVSGSIGDSGAGLRSLRGEIPASPALEERYRNPRPRLEAGEWLAPLVSAMMDVSDGLLIDAARLGEASSTAVEIDLGLVPLSEAWLSVLGDDRSARLSAATAGDDYELLFTAPPEASTAILEVQDSLPLPLSRIGEVSEGTGLRLTERGEPVPLPERLGWEHGASG